MTDDNVTVAEESAPEPTNEWIEYEGDPDNPKGIDFLHSHTIPKGDPVWKRLGVKPTKDLVWERDPLGKPIGFKGNRLLLPTEGLDPSVVTALVENVPGFKAVNE